MFERLFRRRPAPLALRGAPPIRRQKTYSAQTGFVYQYYYEGYRAVPRGSEYVFQVTAGRQPASPLTVLVETAAVETWQQAHGRDLTATEQYAAAKMALFQAFDERAELGAVEVGAGAIEGLLGSLEIE